MRVEPLGTRCEAPGCTMSIGAAQSITLRASPKEGYRFEAWEGDCARAGQWCELDMSASRQVGVRFAAISPTLVSLRVSVSGSGQVRSTPAGIDCPGQCSAQFSPGASLSLRATASANSQFRGWQGACEQAGDTCSLQLDGPLDLQAGFAAPDAQASLSVTVEGQGRVRSQPEGIDCASRCSASFAQNTLVQLSAEPSAGQAFGGWRGACIDSQGQSSCRLLLGSDLQARAQFVVEAAPQTWSTPERLDLGDARPMLGRMLFAVARQQGTAMLLWEQAMDPDAPTLRRVLSRRYVPGVGWDAPAPVPGLQSSDPTELLVDGMLAADDRGDFLWLRRNLQARRGTADGRWFLLGAGETPGGVALAMAPQGSVADRFYVLAARPTLQWSVLYPAAGSWTTWRDVDPQARPQAGQLSLASSGQQAVAAWMETRDGLPQLRGAIYRSDSGQGWQSLRLDEGGVVARDGVAPRIAMAGDKALVTWAQGPDLVARRLDATGNVGAPVQVQSGGLSAAADIQLQIADDERELAWQNADQSLRSVGLTAGTLALETILPLSSTGRWPTLGTDAQSRRWAAYVERDPLDGTERLLLRQRRSPAGWGTPQAVDAGGGTLLRLVGRSSVPGRSLLVWLKGNNGSISLWASVSQPAGMP